MVPRRVAAPKSQGGGGGRGDDTLGGGGVEGAGADVARGAVAGAVDGPGGGRRRVGEAQGLGEADGGEEGGGGHGVLGVLGVGCVNRVVVDCWRLITLPGVVLVLLEACRRCSTFNAF